MQIEISDVELTKMIQDEFVRSRTRTMYHDSSLDKCVKSAVFHIIRDKIIVMIKEDRELMECLTKDLSLHLEGQLGQLGVRIAGAIVAKVHEAMEAEFREYRDT